MMNPAQKTPVSLLQDLCTQNDITPEYELISVEGAVHAPTFMYKVKVNEVIATATGHSKKKAKHNAAKMALEKLFSADGQFHEGFESDGVLVNAQTLNEIISETVTSPPVYETIIANPVGKLQEACTKYKWPAPYYETEKEIGPPHEKTFSIMCVVNKHTEIGEAKSKKLAKRQAAHNMMLKLKALNLVTTEDINREPKPKEDSTNDSSYSEKCDDDIMENGKDIHK